jgi:very-short-patch-repair endonuclease
LRRAGWSVLRLWETDILNAPNDAAEQILKRVRFRARLGAKRRL